MVTSSLSAISSIRLVLGAVLHIDHVLKVDHFDAHFLLMLTEQVLGIIGAIEIFTGAVLARAGVVAANDEVGQPWFLRISPCQTASRGPAIRMASGNSDMVVVEAGYLSSTAS